MKQILCLITARSGSKGIKDKNIKNFNGHPLMAWSIMQAQKSRYFSQMRIIVSTDSQQYADIARSYGAETPFIRPHAISLDLSSDYECIHHSLLWLKENESYNPDLVIHLRPTQPCRTVEHIDTCLDLFINSNYDSLRSVVPFEKSPYKMYTIKEVGETKELIPLFNKVNNISEPYNQCRQLLPQTYLHNGYIDIFKTYVVEDGSISGNKIYPFIMDANETIDIDTISDWYKAEEAANKI